MKIKIFETVITEYEFDSTMFGDDQQGNNKDELVDWLEEAAVNVGFSNIAGNAKVVEAEKFLTVDSKDGELFT